MNNLKEGDLAYRVFEGANSEAVVLKVTVVKCGKVQATVRNLGSGKKYHLYFRNGDFLFSINDVDSDEFFIELSRKFIHQKYAHYNQISNERPDDKFWGIKAEEALKLIPSVVFK